MNKSVGYREEFVLDRVSTRSIWNQISTSRGLSEWLAPQVCVRGKEIVIDWDGEGDKRKATIEEYELERYIKWRWDDDPDSYVAMEIVKTELTSTVSLLVEDHDVSMDTELLENLWIYHMEKLRHTLGID